MLTLFAITTNELRRIWLQRLVWVIFSFTFLMLALLFLVLLNTFYVEVQTKFTGVANAPGVTDLVMMPLLFWTTLIGSAVLPIFALRIVTEEKIRQQAGLLSTAPISAYAIASGKALALASIVFTFTLLTLVFSLSITLYVNLDWGKLFAGMIGSLLFQTNFALLCLWLSSCTQSTVFSVLSNYAALLFLFLLYFSGSSYSSESSLFVYLSNFAHLLPALSGLVTGQDVYYFLITGIGFLTLTAIRMRYIENK